MISGANKKRLWLAQRAVVVVSVLILSGIAWPSLAAAEGIDRELCEHCRRFSDTSPARIEASVTLRDVTEVIPVCSLYCLCRVFLEKPELELNYSLVVDYLQVDAVVPGKVRTEKAWYVFVPDFDIEHTHPPALLAFRDEETAREQAELLEGTVVEWEKLYELVKELAQRGKAKDDEEKERDRPRPLRYR